MNRLEASVVLRPDSFPVFDVFRENCYIIADSNHGYKMIGVGKLVAEEIMGREIAIARTISFFALCRRPTTPGFQQPIPLELAPQEEDFDGDSNRSGTLR